MVYENNYRNDMNELFYENDDIIVLYYTIIIIHNLSTISQFYILALLNYNKSKQHRYRYPIV